MADLMTAARLKAILKGLPRKVLLGCNPIGNINLYLEREDNHICLGYIDTDTGTMLLQKCPICAEDLEKMETGNKRRCPKCKQVYREGDP